MLNVARTKKASAFGDRGAPMGFGVLRKGLPVKFSISLASLMKFVADGVAMTWTRHLWLLASWMRVLMSEMQPAPLTTITRSLSLNNPSYIYGVLSNRRTLHTC